MGETCSMRGEREKKKVFVKFWVGNLMGRDQL
jgi:hypothetical protein